MLIQLGCKRTPLWLPPAPIRHVPGDGVLQSVRERYLRVPAELALELGVVEEVAAIMSRAILNVRLQRGGLPGRRQYRVGDLLDAPLLPGPDVVRLAGAAAL